MRRFSMGGYRFDDWSQVMELFIPENVSSSTDKTLHVRGREALPHHLRHYAVPAGKVFIAFAANVQLSTPQTIGVFGEKSRYTPQGPPAAWVIGGAYWYGGSWGTLVQHEGIVYECKSTHTGASDKTPPDGTYWTTGSEWTAGWVDSKFYFMNQIVTVEASGVTGSYRCTANHTSGASTKPCDADWATKWDAGDEFIADRSSTGGFSKKVLNISEGTTQSFGADIVCYFRGLTAGRWVDAMTIGGNMAAGGILHGIEVDA